MTATRQAEAAPLPRRRPNRRPLALGVLAGWLAAAAGLACAELAAGLLGSSASPLVAVGSWFIDQVPPWLKEFATSTFGTADKLVLNGTMVVVLAVLAGAVGALAIRDQRFAWLALLVAAAGGAAASTRSGFAPPDLIPSVVAGVVAALVLSWLAGRAARVHVHVPATAADGPHDQTAGAATPAPSSSSIDPNARRAFLRDVSIVAAGTVVVGVLGRVGLGASRAVTAARKTLRLPAPPTTAAPAGVDFGAAVAKSDHGALSAWVTPNADFYRIDTALSVPQIDPATWQLRIHGMVDRELTLSLADLVERNADFAWVTLTCVSNPVGGDLVGNALWSGTRIAPILAEAGVHPDADAVMQTSQDGFTAGTPIGALTDGRNALLAYAMNGEPLPVQHGFPVRMVVPGLYGYVSATKWLVDLEVTRFDRFEAYWTQRGWSPKGPIKTESRIDTPIGGAKAGDIDVAGVAWAQHTGVAAVEVRVDQAGEWHRAELAAAPSKDTWRQWRWTWTGAPAGDHTLECRATDVTGYTQTPERLDVIPDGATGWHAVNLRVEAWRRAATGPSEYAGRGGAPMSAQTQVSADERAVLDAVPGGSLVGDDWRDAGADLDVEDPSTGSTLRSVADAGPDDAMAALDAAAAAQAEWAATDTRTRSDILRATYDAILAAKDELALLITLEMGKPLTESVAEVTYGADFFRWFSEQAAHVGGTYRPAPTGGSRLLTMRQPVGPTLLITPWNFPLAMATRKVGAALAAGCTVVFKPAEQTPLTALVLGRLLRAAGLPAGVANVVVGSDAPSLIRPLMADPRLRKISFTGSTAVGSTLLGQAAQNILRSSMELGGNAPFLVFDDADVEAAVDGAMVAKMRNGGESCVAANRFLVQEGIAAEFTAGLTEQMRARVLGRGTDPDVTLGPLIDAAGRDKALALLGDAVERGAEVVTGGGVPDRPGWFLEATVLTGVPADARITGEEVFGPVAPVTTFTDEDEAVRLANDTEFGLVGYAYTRDVGRALRIAERLETGMVGLNQGLVSNAAAPFGGVKQSGLGREGGDEGIAEYQNVKYVGLPLD